MDLTTPSVVMTPLLVVSSTVEKRGLVQALLLALQTAFWCTLFRLLATNAAGADILNK
jgi:hypothetical protein